MGNKPASGGAKKKNSAELTEDEINLLLANTSFNREEIVKWHEGFIKDCPKGIISITFFGYILNI